MRDHQSHKSDHTGTVHGKSDHSRSNDQIKSPQSVQICSKGNGYVISQKHQIQVPVLRPENSHAHQRDRKHYTHSGPACSGKTSHAPLHNFCCRIFVIGNINDKIGKSRTDCADRHSRKDQFCGSCLSTHVCNGDHRKRSDHRANESSDSHRVSAKKASDSKHDGQCGTQRCTR